MVFANVRLTREGRPGDGRAETLEEGRKSLVATSLAHFMNDGLTGVLPLMYPVFVSVYQLSYLTISVLTSLQNAFSIVVSPLIGQRSDVSGNFSRMIAFGLAILSVGAAGYAFSGLTSYGIGLVILLIPFTVLIGVGSSFYHPLGATVLRAKWRADDLGRAMGINGSAGSLGRIALPLVATFMISAFNLASVGSLGVLSLVGAFVILVLMRKVRFEGQTPRGKNGILRSMLPEGGLAKRMLPLTVVSFSRGLFTGVLPFIPLYLSRVDHFTDLQSGILFSATLGIGIASQLLFGYMHDHLGPKISLAVSNLGGVIVLFAFALTSNPFLAVVSLLLFGLFSYSAFPLLLGLVHILTDFNEMTSAGAIVWGIGNTGGSAVAPLLVGALALPMFFGTLTAGFVAAAAIGIVSVVLMPFVSRESRPA